MREARRDAHSGIRDAQRRAGALTTHGPAARGTSAAAASNGATHALTVRTSERAQSGHRPSVASTVTRDAEVTMKPATVAIPKNSVVPAVREADIFIACIHTSGTSPVPRGKVVDALDDLAAAIEGARSAST